MNSQVITKNSGIYALYRGGAGAIVTSLVCSLCTCVMSQLSLSALGDTANSPETQTVVSVAIFVVGYWVVYLVLRRHVQTWLLAVDLIPASRSVAGGKSAKLFFVCASEIFWILALGAANLHLLRLGYSAEAAAAIAQWGINLTIWLPLLPLWEWFAMDYLPTKAFNVTTRRVV
ncbi:MAG: hypothetical protein ACK5GN_11565 [Pseudomonadota bacterium]|jgi:hypothetical protein